MDVEIIDNKIAKRPNGRPPFYDSPEKLQAKIKEYIDNCPDTKTVYFKLKDEVIEKEVPILTITGLALFLGFADRQSFYAYEALPKFSYTMKKARTFIEKEYEMQLQHGNPTGAIFALKNFGWRDDQQVEHTVIHKLSIEDKRKYLNTLNEEV